MNKKGLTDLFVRSRFECATFSIFNPVWQNFTFWLGWCYYFMQFVTKLYIFCTYAHIWWRNYHFLQFFLNAMISVIGLWFLRDLTWIQFCDLKRGHILLLQICNIILLKHHFIFFFQIWLVCMYLVLTRSAICSPKFPLTKCEDSFLSNKSKMIYMHLRFAKLNIKTTFIYIYIAQRVKK